MARRESEVARAEAIVGEELEKFGSWFRARGVIPTVVALRQRFEDVRRAELERLDFKLAALSPEARARVDEVTRLIVEKLLLTPTEQLKAIGETDAATTHAEAIARLFGLNDPPAARDAESPAPTEQRSATGRVELFPRRPKSRPSGR
jgi:glutamyl-tRNA reductase